MSAHPYSLTAKRRGSTATDTSSPDVSRNCGSLLNAPPPARPHAGAREDKAPHRPPKKVEEDAFAPKAGVANVRRSRTPRGTSRRVSVAAGVDGGHGEVGTTVLAQGPLPAAITDSRVSASGGSGPVSHSKRHNNAAEGSLSVPLTASVHAKATLSPSTTTRNRSSNNNSGSTDGAAAPQASRSRSSGRPSVSVIRPRTSVGSHLSDVGGHGSDLYTPIPSSTVTATAVSAVDAPRTAVSPQPTLPASSPAASMERAHRGGSAGGGGGGGGGGGAPRVALVTPRASLQNVDDLAHLTPVHATSSPAAAAAPHTPRETWGGAPTSLQPNYERARSEGASQSRLSGATFVYPAVESTPLKKASAPTGTSAAATEAGSRTPLKAAPPNRPLPAGLHPQRGPASPKEPRRRSMSAGVTRHRPVHSSAAVQHSEENPTPAKTTITTVPVLSLTKLKQPYRRASSPALVSRGPHAPTAPGATDAAVMSDAQDAAEVQPRDDSLAIGIASPHAASEPAVRTSNDFLSHAFLAINEVRAMDSDPSSFSLGNNNNNNRSSSANVGGATMGSPSMAGGAATTPRSFVQRGASTPRAYSPHNESASFTASPVSRALKGKTEASASTTPRLSVSTPRFTVATNTNSLPYTARISREGTPVTGSLSPSALAAGTAAPLVAVAGGADVAAPAELYGPTTPRQGGGSPTTATAPPPRAPAFAMESDMQRDSQDYVAAVAEQVARHYYTILAALDIGRGAALQDDPPTALCLQSMVIDLNTAASLLSYDSRHGITDLLFDDCAFTTMDLAWLSRLRHLTALRFRGPRMTTAMVNRLLAYAPTVQTLTLIHTARLTSLAAVATPESRVHTLQLIQTDFTAAAYENIVNSPVLQHVMLLQVQLRTNIFDLLNTNHLIELHLVGCPDIYYEGLPETEWVSACSPRHEAVAVATTAPLPPPPQQQQQQQPPDSAKTLRAVRGGRGGRGGRGRGAAGKLKKRSASQSQPRLPPPPAFPLRALVVADCPGLQLHKVPFADFRQLEEVSVMYQRGVRASDLAGVLQQGKLTTLRLQEVFVDDSFVQQLCNCTSLQELNLSFCRGMRGVQAVWPALAESLRVLNVSYSDIDDEGLAGLTACRVLCNVYARGCARLRSVEPFRRLPGSVGIIDLTDCSGLENDGFSEPFDCTGVYRLLLAGCGKVRTVTGLRSLGMLEELNLANTSIDDKSFTALAMDRDALVLQTLTRLDLSGCRYIADLADFAAASTTALRNLGSLNLAGSSISNRGVAHVARAVQSNGSGCLSELDVSGCAGVSQLGPLGAVKSLRTLNASCSGVDDDGLAALVKTSVEAFNKELRVLNLSGCTGVSNVGCLGQLARLAVLNLAGTTVDGPASFAGLANCVGLQELDLSECMHLDSVTELVPRLTKLLSLNLSLTNIDDASVAAVGGALKELEVLQMSGCPRVTCITALGDLPLLQRLNLSATRVTDVAPLVRCPQLWDLSVCACAALTTLQPLATARTLQRLDASGTAITADSFQVDWACAALEELDVHDCAALRGVKPGALRQLVSLRRVHASGSGFDDTAVAALAECENLCEVQLSDCSITSLSLLGVVPTLQSIIAHNINVTEEGIAGLEGSESLSTLDLTGCAALRDVSGLRAMRSLTVLTLRGSGVTDASFAAAAAGSWEQSGLRELNVSGCAGFREPATLHTAPDLEVLRAAGSGLNDAGLRLVAQCPSLRRLNVSDCEQLTDLSSLTMLDGLTHLDASNTFITSLAPVGEMVEREGDEEEEVEAGAETTAATESRPPAATAADAQDAAGPTNVEDSANGDFAGWAESSHLRHVVLRGCAALVDVSALRHLAALHSVDLTGSGVEGVSFAQSWSTCESLEVMNVSDCAKLEDVRGLWAAPHLMQLRLDRTAVESLAGAESCTSLEVLEAAECRRLKDIAALRNLPRLQQLQCSGSEITDDSFAEPWTAPHLLEVNFTGCLQLRDVGALGQLPRLRSATFANTYITDVAVRDLSEAPMLEDLDFRGCSRLAHLGTLSRMPHIRALYLSRTCIGNFTFTSVSRCKKLEVLEMEDCPYVTNVFVVFEFGQLRFLKFPPLSRMVGSVLHTCHNLEYLSLHGCPDTFEIESLSILPRLRVLDFRESAIKKTVLAALNECASLEEVDISYCTEITSFDAMGRLPRLRCLSAAGLPVTDDVCVKLTEYPLLEKLVLAECHLLRDVSALQGLPQLHHLDVSESGAGEESFVGIRHMRALEELSVHGCTAIRSCRLLSEAPEGAADTATICLPRLRLVDLSGTGITAASSSEDIAALRRQCPLLTKVYLSGSRANSSVPSAVANIWRRLTGG